MDLMKYIIVGVGCLFVSLILSIMVRNIFAGLGFAILSFGGYILWNYFHAAKNDPPGSPFDNTPKEN